MAVTQTRANTVLGQIENRFSAYIDPDGKYGPKLIKDWDGIPFVIVWEEGPYDWTLAFTSNDTSEEERALIAEAAMEFGFDYKKPVITPRTPVTGVFLEPVNGCVLGLYPD